ncbi:MAG TPA: SCO family protein [Vicinamibacterales bacterium]
MAASASAQMTGAPTTGYRQEPGAVASSVPAPLREIGFDQHLDQVLPLDAQFVDEHGQTVRLGQYFGSKPVVLAFVYYTCPMLCLQVLNATASTLDVLSLDAGKDFEVVLVDFDPRETPAQAAAKKAEVLQRYKRPNADAGWHFLTGAEASIKRVTSAAGFRYKWDDQTKQFAHPTGIIVVTPDGRPARYLFGIEYGPRDVRFALLEASAGRIGSVADALLLYCYHYDPMTGRYGVYVMRTLRIAGVLTVLLIATFVIVMVRREKSERLNSPAWNPSSRAFRPQPASAKATAVRQSFSDGGSLKPKA